MPSLSPRCSALLTDSIGLLGLCWGSVTPIVYSQTLHPLLTDAPCAWTAHPYSYSKHLPWSGTDEPCATAASLLLLTWHSSRQPPLYYPCLCLTSLCSLAHWPLSLAQSLGFATSIIPTGQYKAIEYQYRKTNTVKRQKTEKAMLTPAEQYNANQMQMLPSLVAKERKITQKKKVRGHKKRRERQLYTRRQARVHTRPLSCRQRRVMFGRSCRVVVVGISTPQTIT